VDYRYIITSHVRQRFVERFSKEREQFYHLSSCRLSECQNCRDLAYTLSETVDRNKKVWDSIICAKLHDAKEVKIFNNDYNFMNNLYEKYGYDQRYRFLVDEDIIFVICIDEGKNIVKTCMNVKGTVNGSRRIADFVSRPKYKKKDEQVFC
jgi:hypothetical protein